MNHREVTNKILKHLETMSTETKANAYDEIYQDVAVFGSSFLRFNEAAMTFELVPRDWIYKTELLTEEGETKTPQPPIGE